MGSGLQSRRHGIRSQVTVVHTRIYLYVYTLCASMNESPRSCFLNGYSNIINALANNDIIIFTAFASCANAFVVDRNVRGSYATVDRTITGSRRHLLRYERYIKSITIKFIRYKSDVSYGDASGDSRVGKHDATPRNVTNKRFPRKFVV